VSLLSYSDRYTLVKEVAYSLISATSTGWRREVSGAQHDVVPSSASISGSGGGGGIFGSLNLTFGNFGYEIEIWCWKD
jgi:hypothetical protein